MIRTKELAYQRPTNSVGVRVAAEQAPLKNDLCSAAMIRPESKVRVTINKALPVLT